MYWQEEAITRVKSLMAEGNTVLSTRHAGSLGVSVTDEAAFRGWKAHALAALHLLLGEDHVYTKQFTEAVRENYESRVKGGVAILAALSEDISRGYLRSVANLVSADLFADFLGMAQHLLDNQYKEPAASLCGAVLENGLRRIAQNNDVKVLGSDDLSSLTHKCAQAKLFNNLVRQQIVAWTTLRNHADHGQFDEYTSEQVSTMVEGVRAFLAAQLG